MGFVTRGYLIKLLLIVVGVITVLPVIVAFFPARTEDLYGITIQGDTLLILMRHRAVLLGILGCGLVYGAFKPQLRLPIIAAAMISKAAFIVFTLQENAAGVLLGIAAMDAGLLLGLIVVTVLISRTGQTGKTS